MKKRIIAFTLVIVSLLFQMTGLKAQVTIGSDTPPQNFSILEIISSSNNTGGLRLPQLTSPQRDDITAQLQASTEKSRGLVIFNTNTTQIEYWDGTQWVAAKGVEPWMVSGTSEVATSNDQNIYQMGQVTIGSDEPADPTAALNVVATNKGALLPRVTLTGPHDIVTIPNPTVGLLVYNTGNSPTFNVTGYLYWDGVEWMQFASMTSRDPEITGLDCINARISPTSYQAGQPYEGVLIVPYSGGNGGYHASSAPIISTGVTGLTATLQPGNLAYGNGELIYTLSGVPSMSSPELATFNIDFLGFSCSASVGANSIRQGEIVFWHGSMSASVFGENNKASDLIGNMPVIEDALRLDAYFSGSSASDENPVTFVPRIYNVSQNPVKFWWGGVTSIEGRGRSNVVLASGGYQNLDNGMYMGRGQNMMLGISNPANALDYGNTSQETMTIDVFYQGKWYRVFFTGWVDNKDTTTNTDNTREIYITYQRMY